MGAIRNVVADKLLTFFNLGFDSPPIHNRMAVTGQSPSRKPATPVWEPENLPPIPLPRNERTMYGITDEQRKELADRADSEFDNWAPEVVRKVAKQLLTEDSYRTVVMRITLTDEVIGTPGVLTSMDKALDAIALAYQDREPKRLNQYNELQVTVWAPDSDIRRNLKYYAERARKEIAEEAAAEETEITAMLDEGNGNV